MEIDRRGCHKTMLNEFYRITFRKKIHDSIPALQPDLDAWLDRYNKARDIRDGGATAGRLCVPSSIHSNSPVRN